MFFEVATNKCVLVSMYQPEECHKEDYSWLMSNEEEEAGDEAPDSHQTSEDAPPVKPFSDPAVTQSFILRGACQTCKRAR